MKMPRRQGIVNSQGIWCERNFLQLPQFPAHIHCVMGFANWNYQIKNLHKRIQETVSCRGRKNIAQISAMLRPNHPSCETCRGWIFRKLSIFSQCMASTGHRQLQKKDKIWINTIICAKMKVLVKGKVKLFTIPRSFNFYTPSGSHLIYQ